MVEFLCWYDDLQDPEVELLKGVRRQYMEDFFSKVEGGGSLGRCAAELDASSLPIW